MKNIPDLPNFKNHITIEEISEALAMYFSSYSLDEIAFKYKVQKDILSHHIRYLKQVKQFKDRQNMKENKRRSRKRTQKVIKEVEDLIL